MNTPRIHIIIKLPSWDVCSFQADINKSGSFSTHINRLVCLSIRVCYKLDDLNRLANIFFILVAPRNFIDCHPNSHLSETDKHRCLRACQRLLQKVASRRLVKHIKRQRCMSPKGFLDYHDLLLSIINHAKK